MLKTVAVIPATGTGNNVLATLPSFTGTIGVGGATAAASGAGITFPATVSLSTDPNTLDDYEEGTYKPSFTGLSLGNAAGQSFKYTKVGNVVTVTLAFIWGSTSSSSGVWEISVPFTCADAGGGSAYMLDIGTSSYAVVANIASVAYGGIRLSDGTGAEFVSNTAPFTWAVGDRFSCCVTYLTT